MQAAANKTSLFRQVAVFIELALALVLAIGWLASVGQFGVTIGESLSSVVRLVFNVGPGDTPEPVNTVLWQVRLPCIALACLVDVGLALAGTALQAVLDNPLAESGLIGIFSGTIIGAATAAVLGATVGLSGVLGGVLSVSASSRAIAVSAFVGNVVTTAIVAANVHGGHDIARVILVGTAVSSICGGLVSLLTFIASTAARDRIVFWQMGPFTSATQTQVIIITLMVILAVTAMWVGHRKLDILNLGEAQTCHLGVNVITLHRATIFGTSLAMVAGVALSGVIIFISLMVPHAARLLLGSVHHTLIPACILGGALTAMLANPATHIMVTGADLSLGMLTSVAGGPLFLQLLLCSERMVY